MTERQRLHDLVEKLPAVNVSTAEKLLETLTEHPAARAMRLAPFDDEPVTAREAALIREAANDPGPRMPFDDLPREYGLK